MTKIISVPVAAVTTGKGELAHHWHAATLNDDGSLTPLCKSVKPEHLLDDAYMFDKKPVSCPICQRKLARINS